jgi:hypothetical protein
MQKALVWPTPDQVRRAGLLQRLLQRGTYMHRQLSRIDEQHQSQW